MIGREQEVIWSSAFQFTQPALWWGRAVLYRGRLELRGWTLRGRYRHVIALAHIRHVDVLANDVVGLWCVGGETVRLRLRDAAEWKRRLMRQQDVHRAGAETHEAEGGSSLA
jgi:hypothetical protein